VLLSTASTDGQLSDGDDDNELHNSALLDAESLASIEALIASAVQCGAAFDWLALSLQAFNLCSSLRSTLADHPKHIDSAQNDLHAVHHR
jgi:hypothetical protein